MIDSGDPGLGGGGIYALLGFAGDLALLGLLALLLSLLAFGLVAFFRGR